MQATELTRTGPVLVTGGDITGYYLGDGVAVYKGIPYAAPPVGDLRWRAPGPVTAWDGRRPCVSWSASAIQPERAPLRMWTREYIIEDTGYSEDCLYLNVWSKEDAVAGKPVIVYIHGGGYRTGGASCEVYDGEYMAQNGAVFVSVNYRLGVLGFLATAGLSRESGNGVSGNYALLDQIAALRWVRENIGRFGGDPGNVTVIGQSAGAGAINALLISPLAKGLFAKAMSMSMSSLQRPFPTLAEAEERYGAAFAGYTLEELRAMDPFALIEINNDGGFCVDGWALPEDFGGAMLAGRVNDVPLVAGMVAGDADLFGLSAALPPDTATSAAYEAAVREAFDENADGVLALYPAGEEGPAEAIRELDADLLNAYQNRLAKIRARGCESETYVYEYTHVMPDETGGKRYGAFHSSELPYLFGVVPKSRAALWTEEDRAVSRTLSSYLLRFAGTGDPNGPGLARWSPSKGDYVIFLLDAACRESVFPPEKIALFERILGS